MASAPSSPVVPSMPPSAETSVLSLKNENAFNPLNEEDQVRCSHCDTPTDILFMSSDGVLLGAHFRDLAHYTGVLGWCADYHLRYGMRIINIVELTSEVLDLLLSFTHPYLTKTDSKTPLRSLPFEKLIVFAHAAEKYQVWLGVHMAKWLVECVFFVPFVRSSMLTFGVLLYRDYVQYYPIETFHYYVAHYRAFDPRYPVIPRAISRLPGSRMEEIKSQSFPLYCYWKDLSAFGSI
ncbi:hypothetical protein AAF712_005613 [Marasmius tenuissimus]|uniref:Uncharacterized protein n=1 Tax=Marasmius tenuissimus TaxID=585030 RepID=A0ABR3A1Y4_9AGAR